MIKTIRVVYLVFGVNMNPLVNDKYNVITNTIIRELLVHALIRLLMESAMWMEGLLTL